MRMNRGAQCAWSENPNRMMPPFPRPLGTRPASMLWLMRTMNSLVAVDLDRGHSKERWRTAKMLADTASPLFYRGLLCLVKNGGLLACVDPESGEILRQDRIPGIEGNIFASPVAADGKLFR